MRTSCMTKINNQNICFNDYKVLSFHCSHYVIKRCTVDKACFPPFKTLTQVHCKRETDRQTETDRERERVGGEGMEGGGGGGVGDRQ